MNIFQIKAFLFFFLPLAISTIFFHRITKIKLGEGKWIRQKYQKNKRWGGVIIGFIFIFLLTLFQLIIPGFLLSKDFFSLILGVLILLAGGLWDDLRNISWKKQLFFQLLAAGVVISVGDTINHIRLPWGEVFYFPFWLAILSALLWIIMVINSLNWFDGVDGLAGSISLVSLLVLGILSVDQIVNQPNTALLCLILAGIILGFLFFNFPPAKVYLGSAGVWIIGFVIAVISLYSGGKIATVALIFGFPLINFILVSFERITRGQYPTIGGDRLHLHEKLIDRGLKPQQVTLIISCFSLLFGVGALTFQTKGKFFLTFFLVLLFLLFYLSLNKSKPPEKK